MYNTHRISFYIYHIYYIYNYFEICNTLHKWRQSSSFSMTVYRTKCFCCGSVGSLFKCSRCTTLFLVYPVDDNAVVSLTYHSYCIKLTLSHPGNADAIRCRWTSSISWRSEANSSNYNSEYSEAASWQKLLDRGNQLDCCIPRAYE